MLPAKSRLTTGGFSMCFLAEFEKYDMFSPSPK